MLNVNNIIRLEAWDAEAKTDGWAVAVDDIRNWAASLLDDKDASIKDELRFLISHLEGDGRENSKTA